MQIVVWSVPTFGLTEYISEVPHICKILWAHKDLPGVMNALPSLPNLPNTQTEAL